MPICKKCGVDLPDGAKFCLECGTPVVKASGSQQEEKSSEDYGDKTQIRGKPQEYGVVSFENIPVGYIISERYEVQEKVGQGGFGAVYRCFDKKMDIDKALKIIPEAVSSDKETMSDLQQEARTMIALNQPNIVRVYDFHQSGAIKFIDMEYLDGKNLSEMKLEFSDRKVPEALVKEYALKIAEGMAYAHSKGVLHKDIKPHNVKITSDGSVKIMDFGIAETVRTSMSRLEHSSSSGTLVYMSPEQLRGKNVGKEADVYSFGAMLYELLSGQPPFFKGDIQYQIINEQPESLEHISAEMNSFLLKCLEKDYKNRYRNFNEILEYWGGKAIVSKNIASSPIKAIHKKSDISGIKKLVPVNITTTPKDVSIYIDGKKFTADEISVGTHNIKIALDGYKPVDSDIEITETSSNRFHIALEPIFGKLTVTSERAEMPIILNGFKTSYKTPHTFKDIIPQKEYQVELESKDFYSDPVTIKLNENEEKTMQPELSKFSVLTIETAFQDIKFNEDGKEYSKTELIQLKQGKHILKPSYKYLPDLEVNIEKNKDLTVNYDKIVPKRKLLIESGNYEINAFYKYSEDSLSIPIKSNEEIEILSGSGTLTIESSILKKEYITDNQSEVKIDFLQEIDRVLEERKKKKRSTIFKSLSIAASIITVIALSMIAYYSINERIEVIPQVEAPTFNPSGGTYKAVRSVSISCTTDGSTIRYTTNGSDPTASSSIYSSPINVSKNTTLKAKAFKSGWDDSTIATVEYLISPPQTVATPRLNPRGGSYTTAQRVSISCATDGSTIRYTTNGSDPTSSSSIYSRAINVTKNTTLKAKAFKSGWNGSSVAIANYSISAAPSGMVYVPGGTFKMGRTKGDGYSGELPVHNVTLDSFYISKYPVTQKEYAAVMGSNPARNYGVGDNYPVYYVSWYSAIKFCNLLSMKEGLTPVYSISGSTNPANWGSVPTSSNSTWNKAVCNWNANGYRLPTEAEWEYAARGGTNNPDYLYSGSDDIKKVAWYSGNSSGNTHPVGGKAPNGLGIYDMSGNLDEWCWDWYESSYYKNSPSSNPKGPTSGSYRLLRGGGWSNNAAYCRVAYRDNYYPYYSSNYVGFRLCRTFP